MAEALGLNFGEGFTYQPPSGVGGEETMAEAMERAQRARHLLERLGARVPGFAGYLQRELRREVDELLRQQVAGRLEAARRELAQLISALSLAQAAELARCNRWDKELDSLAQQVRAAGAGYAGLFDAAKVREEELARLYEVDLALAEGGEELLAVVTQRRPGWEEDLERRIHHLRQALAERPAVVRGVFAVGRS